MNQRIAIQLLQQFQSHGNMKHIYYVVCSVLVIVIGYILCSPIYFRTRRFLREREMINYAESRLNEIIKDVENVAINCSEDGMRSLAAMLLLIFLVILSKSYAEDG